MYLDVLPLQKNTLRLCRVYGEKPCIALPAVLPGEDGTALPITELGDYCFSEKPRSLPAPEQLVRYAIRADGCAEPVSEKTDLHPVCGNFVEEVTLPETLQVVGSCAFYNCRKLRRLSVGSGELVVGSDVFLNCFALDTIVVRAVPDAPTGLFALVNSITEAVEALFQPADADAPLAGLWYPAYWEDYEETPAHILLHTFSGQGYHYRQCFLDQKFLPAEYDAIFPQGHDADDVNIMAMLCFDRLRWPWQLREAAKAAYRDFAAAHTGRILTRLLKAQDLEGIQALLALDLMTPEAFAEGAALAAKADNAAAAALLADAEYRKRAATPRKKRYDFDF